ncbi:MAG TPA: hypothetical protein VKR79_11950 [Gaiellaceae bacterium]|nr:hypothetical protein [Gaiellaceae bacterium]
MRRSLAWLVAVPLMLAGSQVAHVLAYRIVYPEAGIRLQALIQTGHGYLSTLPIALGVAGAIVVLSLAASVADAARGRGVRPLPPWTFALLPVAGFAIQEYLERWLAWGFFPLYAAAQPTFLIGIALQLPFGAVAYLAARFLLRSAKSLGRRLVHSTPPRIRVAPLPLLVPATQPLPPLPSLLSRRLGRRGPPLLAG